MTQQQERNANCAAEAISSIAMYDVVIIVDGRAAAEVE